MAGWIRAIWLRARAVLKQRQLERDLEEELAFHLAMSERKNLERGRSAEEARYAARRQFGNVQAVKELCREAWTIASLETLRRDLQYGMRTMARTPGFTAVAVLTIALGIGVNTGIFSALNGVALRLLPVPRADQLVGIDLILHGKVHRNTHGEPGLFSYPEYLEYRDNNHVFSGLLAYEPFLEATIGGERPQKAAGAAASCNYFDVLKQKPQLGRTFADADCLAAGASAVAVISDNLWRSRFAGDPTIVGKSISLNRSKFTVVGVAAPGFNGADPWPNEFWAPLTMQKALEPDRDFLNSPQTGWLAMLGRLNAGVSLGGVRSDLGVIAGRIDAQEPGRQSTLAIHPATYLGRPEERRLVIAVGTIVLAAVGLVLLIACANVANLLLAQASTRQREIAIRLSIGGSRWQVVRQLLTESLLISLMGGTLGSLVAFWSMDGISRFVIEHLPQGAPQLTLNVNPDLRVWGYSLALTLLTTIAFGLAPALHATRGDLAATIKGEGPGSAGKNASASRLRRALVGVQVGVCMVLLIAAGLLMRSLYLAQTVDPGFEMKGITQVAFDLPSQGYNEERARTFQRDLIARVSGFPGVDAVEQARVTPLNDQFLETAMTLEGETESRQIEFNIVSAGYFDMLKLPIVRGRGFTRQEVQADAGVMVVTESTARRLWPGKEPIGQTMRDGKKQKYQVVGVVKDAQVSHLGDTSGPYFYIPAGPKEQPELMLLVRMKGDQAQALNGIRGAAKSLDPDLVVEASRLEDNLELWRTPSRIAAVLSGLLGALALLLAASGVYGVASYSVSQRVHEIGVRMALGADARDVMKLLLRQTLRPVGAGALIGVAVCAAVSQVLAKVLYGLGSHDPIAFLGVPMFLLLVAFSACYLPTRRATRIDPAAALRYE